MLSLGLIPPTRGGVDAFSSEILGNILAANSGKVSIHTGNSSIFIGRTDNYSQFGKTDHNQLEEHHLNNDKVIHDQDKKTQGTINLDLGSNSKWYITGDSWLDSFNLSDGVVNFAGGLSDHLDVNPKYFHTLSVNNLYGNNNVINLRINMLTESKESIDADQLIIGNAQSSEQGGSAEHKVLITLLSDTKNDKKVYSDNFLIRHDGDNDLTMQTINPLGDKVNYVAANGSLNQWKLVYVKEESQLESSNRTEYGNTGNKGYWHLVRADVDSEYPDNPDTPDLPNEGKIIEDLGSSAGQYLVWRSDMSDLRLRLGEVRYGAQDGIWGKAIYTKERSNGLGGSFKQKDYSAHLGFDKLFKDTEQNSWLAGFSFKAGKAKQYGFSSGKGELEHYTARLYATYINANGFYADIVLQGGYYDQEFKGISNDYLKSVNGSYDTLGYGASLEVGQMFSFGEKVDDRQWYDHWFIEPQLQLAYYYLQGKNFLTSTGMDIDQGDASFLTGRAGIVIGKKFNYSGLDSLDKRYLQIAGRAGVIHEFDGKQEVMVNSDYKFNACLGGTTVYYGLEADWQFAQNQKLYLNADRETGHNYRKEISFRLGYRYSF